MPNIFDKTAPSIIADCLFSSLKGFSILHRGEATEEELKGVYFENRRIYGRDASKYRDLISTKFQEVKEDEEKESKKYKHNSPDRNTVKQIMVDTGLSSTSKIRDYLVTTTGQSVNYDQLYNIIFSIKKELNESKT